MSTEETKQVEVVIEDVQQMLIDGKTREEIRVHYGLNKTDLKALFMHPDLKGKKTHRKPGFVIVAKTTTDEKPQELIEAENETVVAAEMSAEAMIQEEEVVAEEVVAEEVVEEVQEELGAETVEEEVQDTAAEDEAAAAIGEEPKRKVWGAN